MSGSGAAGGFNFQAVVGAFVAAHLLAGEQLRWSTWCDLPLTIAFEQGGAGDDIRIEFSSGNFYEVQVKRGLRADKNLEEALTKITNALKLNERGFIVVDPSSSGTITQGLRNWLDGYRQGSDSSLPNSLAERCQCILQSKAQDALERLHVVELDLEPSYSGHNRLAQALITPLIQNNSSSDAVMDTLITYCHQLMAVRGKCDVEGLRDYLCSRGHKLSSPLDRKRSQFVGFPMRLPKFVGRDDLLEQISDEFKGKSTNFGQMLLGISGSGKSSIAAEYAFQSDGFYDQIIWLDASNIPNTVLSLVSMLTQMRNNHGNQSQSFLIILDDLDDFECGGEQLLHILNELQSWHILATSTNDSWRDFFYAIPIPYLDINDAVKMLIGDLPTREQNEAFAIVEWVDRLPLAIAQLSTYASKTLEPWSKILNRLEIEGTRLFGHKPAALRTYKETVATCWQIVLKKLDSESTKLLKFLSFINSREIPLDLITYWFENTNKNKLPIHIMAVPEATSGLSDWLILNRGSSGIECHRLIQEVVRISMTDEERKKNLVTWFQFFIGFLGYSGSSFRAYVRLKNHALKFLDDEQVKLLEIHHTILSLQLSQYMWNDDPFNSLKLLSISEKITRKAGSNANFYLAMVLNLKGVIYNHFNDLANASNALDESLQLIRGQTQYPLALAAIIDNKAQVIQKQSESEKALKLYKEALELRKKNSASMDEIIVTLSNIVSLLLDRKLQQEAQCYLDKLLTLIQERSQDKDYSPNYVSVCLKTAKFCETLGDTEKAIGLSVGALAVGRQVYGHGTKRYLEDSLNSIAMWLRIKEIEVIEWFVQRSLLALPESIRPIFWFNAASLCIAYGYSELGIKFLQNFVEQYIFTQDELLQEVIVTVQMMIQNNKENPENPSFSFLIPTNIQLDLPNDISAPDHICLVSLDMELHARIED